jgi:hypothetical protein
VKERQMTSVHADESPAALLSLPYRDRQLIAVVRQGVNPIEHRQISLGDYFPKKHWNPLRKKYWTDNVEIMKKQRNEGFTKQYWANPKNWGLYGYAFDKLRERREPSAADSTRHLRLIRADLAESTFSFPPGHPLYETAYAGHPLKPSVYLPVAGFHRALFEEKVNELLKLLVCLRASDVTIHHVRGYQDAFAAGGGLAVPAELPVEVRASAGRATSHHSAATLEARFTPVGNAHIPEDTLWYAHEPTWRSVAEARMFAGLRVINVDLHYDDDFGIGGEIAMMLAGFGFRLGGEFQKHERTIWKFHGSFG